MRLQDRPDRPRQEAELPLTSLIDVVFLLLIFFMLTSAYVMNESRLSSALQMERSASGRAADLQPQIVHVEQREGRATFRLGERIVASQAELTSLLASLPKEGGVFVRVSDAAPVEGAAAALQAARDAGFIRVSYVPAR